MQNNCVNTFCEISVEGCDPVVARQLREDVARHVVVHLCGVIFQLPGLGFTVEGSGFRVE